MTSKTNDIFEQFNTLIGSNLPDEYKNILKNFQEQGVFYQQLLQSINNKNEDLSEFWTLPNTLGFNTDNAAQPDGLKSILGMGYHLASNEQLSLFSQAPQQIQDSFKRLQKSLSSLDALHSELSELAMKRFQVLQDESNDTSNEQMCAHWLSAGEAAFNEIRRQEGYIQAQQTFFESLDELKNKQKAAGEQLSNLFGTPSQQSIQDLQKGLHQLRIEFAQYKEHTDATIHDLTLKLSKHK